MARIRTIKPEFWTDGNIVKLSPFARLLFIGMWNFAMCDAGHLDDDVLKLKLQILPLDDVNINELLLELIEAQRVVRFEVQKPSFGASNEVQTYLMVKNFELHQKVDSRWTPRCPACNGADYAGKVDSHPNSPELPLTPQVSPKLPQGKERKGKVNKRTSSNDAHLKEFDGFWQHYPRKVGKLAAQRAFEKALKLTTVENIQKALHTLNQEVRGKDPQYIPHPATWLNQGRWDDEQAPVAKSPWSKEFHNG